MSLIALIIALTVERIRHPHRSWHFKLLYQKAFNWVERNGYRAPVYWLALLLPVSLLQLVLWLISDHYFGLLTFIIWVSIPVWIIGCPGYQKMYRQYLQAASEGDHQACTLFADGLVQAEHGLNNELEHPLACEVGQQLIWINYRYYFAVIFYFVLLGPTGALAYAGFRELAQWQEDHPNRLLKASSMIRLLDWLPTRIVMLGFALVGNFSKVLPLLFASLLDFKTTEREWIAKVAIASEGVDSDCDDLCMKTTFRLVALAKRNVMLFIAVVALLTIYGRLV